MPEIKRNFLQGKMNKDLDERLVPNGQYRHAENIEISTSDDSNVGSIQNILGNKHIDSYPDGASESTFFPTNPTCVGSIADERDDSLYWLVTGDELIPPHYNNGQIMLTTIGGSTPPFVEKDMILRYKDGLIDPVFVDISSVLVEHGLSGNTKNTINVSSLNNIGVGMTVTGYIDDVNNSSGPRINTVFTTTVTALGSFVSQNVGWTSNYDMILQPNATANPNNPFSVEIQGSQTMAPGSSTSTTTSAWAPTNTLLIPAQYPGQFLSNGDIVSGPGIPTGTEVTNVIYPSSYPGHIEVTLDQTPSVTGSYPWFTQVNFVNPSSTIGVPTLTNLITIPNAPHIRPTALGMQVGMEIVGTDFPSGTTIVSIDESNPNQSYLTLSNIPFGDSTSTFNVLGGAQQSSITVADEWPFSTDPALWKYPEVDYLVFTRDPVLNFSKDRLITGLNIIDDMLFWTDNYSEPKKINIPRSLDGTHEHGMQHTKLINTSRNIDTTSNITDIEEEHITVIRKSPTNPPVLVPSEQEITEGFVDGDVMVFHPNGVLVEVGDTVQGVQILATDGEFKENDIVLFQETTLNATSPLPSSYTIKVELLNKTHTSPPSGAYLWDVTILWINTIGTSTPVGWDAIVDTSGTEKLFTLKFPRFATRYKYEDNEYSSFSPFSQVCFYPGEFRYKPHEGYNLGMENTISKITLTDLVPRNIPDDVVQVDILYKESNSPNIYVVDSIKPDDPILPGKTYNSWTRNIDQSASSGTYEITSDALYAAIPSNQLLRSWDNVPLKALGQEITANRIVYGNYEQNHDLKRIDETEFKADFNIYLDNFNPDANDSKSLKSERDYQVGITFFDKYGRETPILTSESATFKVPKRKSKRANRARIKNLGRPPAFAKAYKYYIKENSNEYYNLAMDRFYDAEDGNIWLSFYSYDRNKVDEETWIELKKTVNGEAVEEPAKYKILAIENEAPDHIKIKRKRILNADHDGLVSLNQPLFNDLNNYPIETAESFVINAQAIANGPAADLQEKKELQVRLVKTNTNQKSKWYKVEVVSESSNNYLIELEEPLGVDVDFITDTALTTSTNTSGATPSYILLEITEGTKKESAQFDGRFFVKVLKDNNLREYTTAWQDTTVNQQEVTQSSEALYLFDQNVAFSTGGPTYRSEYWTGTDGGLPINYLGSEFYYSQGGANANSETIDLVTGYSGSGADDFRICKGKWRYYFGDGSSNVPGARIPGGTATGPKWIIDALGYAGKMPLGTTYAGWTSDNQVGTKPEVVLSMGNPMLVPTSGFTTTHPNGIASGSGFTAATEKSRGINAQGFIDISFVGIDSVGASTYANPPDWGLWFDVGGSNQANAGESSTVELLQNVGQKIKFGTDDEVYTIEGYQVTEIFNLQTSDSRYNPDYSSLTSSGAPFTMPGDNVLPGFGNQNGNDYTNDGTSSGDSCNDISDWFGVISVNEGECRGFPNRRKRWRLELDRPLTVVTRDHINNTADHDTAVDIKFIRYDDEYDIDTKTTNPAIWETEPKPTTDIDLFYEASNVIPVTIDHNWDEQVLKPGMTVTTQGSGNTLDESSNPNFSKPSLAMINGGKLHLSGVNESSQLFLADKSILRFHDGNESISVAVDGDHDGSPSANMTGMFSGIAIIKIDPDFYNGARTLPWFNCYSFGNGVESNRIRDDFNAITMDKGARVSTVSPEPYKQERRKYGLIYSGLYNSNSGVNNLNQFIQAEKITKDINPTYGSIQKLFARKHSLVAFCEDRVLRILSNKDALFNADGNAQLVSTNRVLGEATPFEGDYGISKNPESFAKESYRAYFTDKQRGVVLRLSKDGLTPISEYGMSDYFKDNLKLGDRLIGGFDDRKDQYNLTIKTQEVETTKTISYTEAVRGWVSFKSFIPENNVSLSSDYYTFELGKLYKHYVPLRYKNTGNPTTSKWTDIDENGNLIDISVAENYNVFYGVNSYDSSVKLLLNDEPGTIKSFKTLNYEGSQSKVDQFTTTTTQDAAGNALVNIGDGGFYNLEEDIDPLTGNGLGYISGWYVDTIVTDEQQGSVKEFIDKENKWYNYILGKPKTDADIDAEEFSFQGVGMADIVVNGEIFGCTEPLALNYNLNANVDNGSCIAVVSGCMDPNASNFDNTANTDDGSCIVYGCTDSLAFNYNPLATVEDNTCVAVLLGCTDPTMFNYDPTANTLDGSCVPVIVGCTDNTFANGNYNSLANTPCGPNEDNSCCSSNPIVGCMDPSANNYDSSATVNNGCTYNSGCMDDGNRDQTYWDAFYSTIGPAIYPGLNNAGIYPLSNYDNTAVVEDGSCVYPAGCTDSTMFNYDALAVVDDGSCLPIIQGCMDGGPTNYTASLGFGSQGDGITATNYDPQANTPCGSCCTYDINGCTDSTATNYNSNATVDDGSCAYCQALDYHATKYNTHSGGNNGKIQVGPTSSSSYGFPYLFTLTNSSGASMPISSWSAGGFGHRQFVNLPAGAYTLTITSNQYPVCVETQTFTITSSTATTFGCMDPNAYNHNALATAEDGSCVYQGCLDNSVGITTFNHPQAGTIFSNSTSYTNPISATIDCAGVTNGTNYTGCCSYTYGCTSPTANNYNASANTDDGSCTWGGCTDPQASNFFAAAGPYLNGVMSDDGSCEYHGCNDPAARNYNNTYATLATNITHLCDGSSLTSGCTYPTPVVACNSCCVYCPTNPISLNTNSSNLTAEVDVNGNWNGEIVLNGTSSNMTATWSYTGSHTDPFAISSPTSTTLPANLPPGDYDVTIKEINADGTCTWVQSTITITEIIYGCTDLTANNYCGCTGGSGCNTQGSGYNYDGGNITFCDGTCTFDVGGCNDPTAMNHLTDCQWASNSSVSTNDCNGFNICEYCDSVSIRTGGILTTTPQVRHYDGTVVAGSVNIGSESLNISGLSGGVTGDTYSVWLTKDGDANGVKYDFENGGSDPLLTTSVGTYASAPNSHIFPLNVPTSVFANTTDTSPTDDMEAHVTTFLSFGNSSDLDAHKCDSVLIDDFEQHIYGCMVPTGGDGHTDNNYNYDSSVTHTGFSPADTSSPCASCTHNPFAQFAANDGDVRIKSVQIDPENGSQSDGEIEVTFEGFASDPSLTHTTYQSYARGVNGPATGDILVNSGTQLSALSTFTTNAGVYEWTETFSNLQSGTYRFEFESTRTHTLHNGNAVSVVSPSGVGYCSSYIDITVPQG